MGHEVRVAEIAHGFAAVDLVEFEVRAVAAALGFGMLQGTTGWRLNGRRVKFRNTNRKVHRALQDGHARF